MGKIYFNALTKKVGYYEEGEATTKDILFSEMAGNIVLRSINAFRKFTSFDPYKKNEAAIKNLVKVGFKPVNKFNEFLLTQNYTFCPNCGEDIDIEESAKVIILDSGMNLENIVNKNLYPAKELTCKNCNHNYLYYYDLYAEEKERHSFLSRSVDEDTSIFIKYRYIIENSKKGAWVPILFDFSQFNQLFKQSNELNSSDIGSFLKNKDDKTVISMLFNERLLRTIETKDNILVGNMKVELYPVEFGNYKGYTTKMDYDEITEYIYASDNREDLLVLMGLALEG